MDAGHHRLIRLSDAGTTLSHWGRSGDLPGEFRFALPQDPDEGAARLFGGVAVGADGSTLIADLTHVQRFDRAGRVVAIWPAVGPDGSGLALAAGIAVDDQDNVYLADTGRGLVVRFRPREPWPTADGAPTPRPAWATATPGPSVPATPAAVSSPPVFMTPTDR